ncbi:tetratricopeptide repeat protein [Paenibacillus sp. PL91]|uniref:tetratricopeptide repeat protein n=1 Tax=Paenibacillus sp. PL91 TaxID=2729538 RepID=UPI00145D65BD|nr:tetratricopeptide repeat protein [Paenibacillus sp. PL91]MBC9204902.1 tetratricopeptide repeat protein [Paenibacillus sp. PL91]
MIERAISSQRHDRIQQLMQWNKYKEASEEALQLIRETPYDPDAYALLGHVCLRMENYDQAIHWSGEALQRDPENELAWFVRANTYYEMEHWKDALEAIDEAQRIDPYEPHYFFLRANISNKKAKFNESRDYLLKGLEISPENPLYLANLSYTEALLKNNSESKRLSNVALRLEVESDLVYLYLAWSAEQRSDYDDYLLMLKNAIRLDPDNKQIRQEFLKGLQKNYTFYRIMLMPGNLIKKMKPWQVFLSWIVLWFLFRPLVIVFIVLYIITHWVTRLLVHVKVFGWTRRR